MEAGAEDVSLLDCDDFFLESCKSLNFRTSLSDNGSTDEDGFYRSFESFKGNGCFETVDLGSESVTADGDIE